MFSGNVGAGSERKNRLLAGYLAAVAGYANSAGYVLIGTFSSHVTGNVGRMANDVSLGDRLAALSAVSLVLSFFAGAFLVSVLVESRWLGHASRGYGVALSTEALLLAAFTIITSTTLATHPRVLDAQATLLCAAMGMQNGLVTRLSGAVVRTTHLTGVVTDLGIEAARWFRYWRSGMQLVLGKNAAERPATAKSLLLLTIASSFTIGALLGAFSARAFGRPAMLPPIIAVALCALYAFYTDPRTPADAERPSRV